MQMSTWGQQQDLAFTHKGRFKQRVCSACFILLKAQKQNAQKTSTPDDTAVLAMSLLKENINMIWSVHAHKPNPPLPAGQIWIGMGLEELIKG